MPNRIGDNSPQSPRRNGLTLAQVLPTEIETASRWIDNWLKQHTKLRLRLLYLIQPAAFFDPNQYRGKTRTTCFQDVISIALVSRSQESRIVLALLSSSYSGSSRVADLLMENGVPVFVGDFGSRQPVIAFLEKSLSSNLSRARESKGVTNRSERWLLTHAMETLGIRLSPSMRERVKRNAVGLLVELEAHRADQQKKFRIYHEICLGEVVCARSENADRTGEVAEDLARMRKFRCDMLIASAPPESLPLMVVEFDGFEIHAAENRREKDSWRDGVLRDAGLTVLRVSSRNPGLAGGIRPVPDISSIRLLKEGTEPFLSFLVEHLAEELYTLQIAVARKERPKLDWWRAELTGRIRSEVREKSAMATKDERRIIISKVLREVHEEMGERFADLSEDVVLDAMDRARHYEMITDVDYMLRMMNPDGHLRLADVKVHVDEETNGVQAGGVLSLSGEEVQRLTTPEFFVNLIQPNHLLESAKHLDSIMTDGAKWVLMHQAARCAKRPARSDAD